MEEIGDDEEAKVGEVSATKSAARGIYCPHFLLSHGLFFPLTIFVADSFVASSHSHALEMCYLWRHTTGLEC